MTTGILGKVNGYVSISSQIYVNNGEGNDKSKPLVKNLYSIDNTQSILKSVVVKDKSTMMLNKQGSLFLGMPKMAMPIKLGYIRSLADEHSGINLSVKYQGGSIYNSLNKHGNTFQGLPANMKKEFVEEKDVAKKMISTWILMRIYLTIICCFLSRMKG